MAFDEGDTVVVMDVGSYECRAGVAGEDMPRIILPSSGTVDDGAPPQGSSEAAEVVVGTGASWPVARGVVRDWEALESLWHRVFADGLHLAPDEHSVLLAEKAGNQSRCRERTAEVAFETFGIPNLSVVPDALLALSAGGRINGLVVDIGYDITRCVALFDGYVLPHSLEETEVAGRVLTKDMMALLQRQAGLSVEQHVAEDIKRKLCHVASQSGPPLEAASYELPDGSLVELDASARCRCPETLFSPGFSDSCTSSFQDVRGVQEAAWSALQRLVPELLKDVLPNVVLAGGTSLIQGLPSRLRAELQDRVPPRYVVRVVEPPQRQFSVWVGGSVLGSICSERWVSKKDYHEFGTEILSRTFF